MGMKNLGLIYGLSQGLKGFLQGRDMADKRDLEDKKLRILAADKGFSLDDEGNLINNIQSDNGALQELAIQGVRMANPNADTSGFEGAIRKLNPKQFKAAEGLIGKPMTGGYGLMGANIRADATKSLAEPRRESVSLQKGNQAAHVADTFNKDQLIKNFSQTRATVKSGIYSLDNPPEGRVTNQLISETSLAIGKALSGAQAVAQGTIHEQTYKTAEGDLAKLKSYITGKPQDIASPATVAHVKETLARLYDVIGNNIEDRKAEVGEGLEDAYANNPQAMKVLKKKTQKDTKKGLMSTSKPKTVVQNGITYTLNEASGEYE